MPASRSLKLLPSGEFADRSRLSTKALRIYAELGLLRPLEVDPSNNYRRYSEEQLPTARLIALLRGLAMSLSDIGLLLADLAAGPDVATARLERHMAGLDAVHASRRALFRHVHSILKGDADPMFTVQVRSVPSRRLMSIQRRLHASETDSFVREAKRAFASHLGEAKATGAFLLIFHGVVSEENDGPIEAALTCSDEVLPSELIGIRTEPAHDEAFTTITKAQWAYPAILAAYDAVAGSPQAGARPASSLSCREVYLCEPDDAADDEMVCDIAFPLGEPQA